MIKPMAPKISIRECLAFGWSAFTKRPLVYVAAIVLVNALWLASGHLDTIYQLSPTAMGDAARILVGVVYAILYAVVMTNFMLRAHDAPDTVGFGDIFRPHRFLKLIGASILAGLAIFLGILALIIPGLVLIAAFVFGGYVAVDKELRPVAALKESARLSRGNRPKLLLMFLLTLASVIPYVIASFFMAEPLAGLVSSITDIVILPVTGIALVHAYRLSDGMKPSEEVLAT